MRAGSCQSRCDRRERRYEYRPRRRPSWAMPPAELVGRQPQRSMSGIICRARGLPQADQRRGGFYSYRSASMGSRRDALKAGYMPKKRPTDAEKPMPIANDHHGSEIGKPETRWTVQPMPAPSAMPMRPPTDVRNAASIRN